MNDCKKCGKPYSMMVQYSYDDPCHYDGVSEYECSTCGIRVGRWTGNILKEGEHEPVYGGDHRRDCLTPNLTDKKK